MEYRSKKVTFSLFPDDIEKLDNIKKRNSGNIHGRNKSATVRYLIESEFNATILNK